MRYTTPVDLDTCLKLAGEAQGLLGCVLKMLKVLIKYPHRDLVEKNGPKF